MRLNDLLRNDTTPRPSDGSKLLVVHYGPKQYTPVY
jgi:hypothetical protein